MPQTRTNSRRTPESPEPATPAANGAEAPADNGLAGFAAVLFEKGWGLREDYERYIAQRKANRVALRSLATQGLLSDAEMVELEKLYPAREAHGTGGENASEPASEPAAA